jgi:hypothetical protein
VLSQASGVLNDRERHILEGEPAWQYPDHAEGLPIRNSKLKAPGPVKPVASRIRELRPLRHRRWLAGFGEHDDQHLGGFSVAPIARHRVKLARRLVEGLAFRQGVFGTDRILIRIVLQPSEELRNAIDLITVGACALLIPKPADLFQAVLGLA